MAAWPYMQRGEALSSIARRLGVSRQAVHQWADDAAQLRAVHVYYAILTALERLGLVLPASCSWFHSERSGCARMGGVALDRRMSFMRQSD